MLLEKKAAIWGSRVFRGLPCSNKFMRGNLLVAGIGYIVGLSLLFLSFLSCHSVSPLNYYEVYHAFLIKNLPGSVRLTSWLVPPGARPILFGSGLVFLGIGYVLSVRWAFDKDITPSRIRHARLFVTILLFLFLFLPPFLSTDVIVYYQYGWVGAYQKANPYLTAAGNFTSSPGKEFLYKEHLHGCTNYGPLWTALESGIYWMSQGSLLLGIVFFKILAAIGSLVLVFSVGRITGVVRPRWELVAIIFLGTQPLLLVEGPGNAHLDVMALAVLAVGISLQMEFRGKTWIGAFFVMAAVLLKAYAVPALFLFFWWLAGSSEPIKSRIWSITQAIIMIVALFVVASGAYITDLSDIPRVFGVGSSVTKLEIPFTLPVIARKVLIQAVKLLGFDFSENITGNLVQAGIMVSASALVFYFIWHARTVETICIALGPVYMIVNMAFSYWRPWYALWPLTLVAILPFRRWAGLIGAYCYLSLYTYLVTHSSGISVFYK